jgi:hypothetical protein
VFNVYAAYGTYHAENILKCIITFIYIYIYIYIYKYTVYRVSDYIKKIFLDNKSIPENAIGSYAAVKCCTNHPR